MSDLINSVKLRTRTHLVQNMEGELSFFICEVLIGTAVFESSPPCICLINWTRQRSVLLQCWDNVETLLSAHVAALDSREPAHECWKCGVQLCLHMFVWASGIFWVTVSLEQLDGQNSKRSWFLFFTSILNEAITWKLKHRYCILECLHSIFNLFANSVLSFQLPFSCISLFFSHYVRKQFHIHLIAASVICCIKHF